jgi:hypothetical protein
MPQSTLGAVLKKIKMLGFGGPGREIRVLKEHRLVAPLLSSKEKAASMAGLGLFGQKSVIAETMPIVTAFKFCIGHRKNGLLNR